MRGKKQFLQNFVVNLDVHVVALQETWLRLQENFYLPGFNVLRRDGPDVYRRVMVAVRKDINCNAELFGKR
jgi:hypothetical protein